MTGDANPKSLAHQFDVVCCVNLKRRRERWERFLRSVPRDWPFRKILPAEAIEGAVCPPAAWWTESPGAWGCYKSHLRVIEECLNTGAKSVLVLEDDAVFADGFSAAAEEFFRHLPDDWQMVCLGGQLLKVHFRPPRQVNDWVYRPFNVNRTHAYAVRGEMLHVLYRHLSSHDWYPHHMLDHHLGRLHESGQYNVYVPRRWLVGQAGGRSDVSGRETPVNFWNHPEQEALRKPSPFVLVLGVLESGDTSPFAPSKDAQLSRSERRQSAASGADAVAVALRQLGLHFGDHFVGETAREARLAALCEETMPWLSHVSRKPSEDSITPSLAAPHPHPGPLPSRERESREAVPAGFQVAIADEQLRVRLGDWLGNIMWQADCKHTIAAATHPALRALAGYFNDFCGNALRVIDLGDGHDPQSQIQRIIDDLKISPTPQQIALANAAAAP